MAQRIVVGVDGSDNSLNAVEWCAEFARTSGVEVIVCHVVSTFGDWMMSAGQIDFQKVERERLELVKGPWTESLRAAGARYEVVQVSSDDAVRELLRIADERDADLIVIGKAGHGAAGEMFLGGIAAKFAHRTTRPLLLVPPRRSAPKPPSG
jgi:nucleotide-binding universal stress UspA family protein